MENEKILLVDDEQNLLDAVRRQFRQEFVMSTARSGKEGLDKIRDEGPFAVVISDMRMPGMDGVRFLTAVRDVSPDTVRMMLTGNADVVTAIQAVNEGSIFRFLTKPCPTATLRQAIMAGLEQFRLVTAERDLLEKTLHGSVKLLTDLLSLLNPMAFGRAPRIKRYIRGVARLVPEGARLGPQDLARMEMAAMLAQIGCVAVPAEILRKAQRGETMSPREQEIYDSHPRAGSDLVANIPRLAGVAEMIAGQNRAYDGSDDLSGVRNSGTIPLGSRILKVVQDFDMLVARGASPSAALASLLDRGHLYDPAILGAMETLIGLEAEYEVRNLAFGEVAPGMVLADNVNTLDGELLIAKGFELSPSIIQRLESFARGGQLKEPICVLVPKRAAADESTEGRAPAVPGKQKHPLSTDSLVV
ncbi:MAG: HD domain-containing phosphohydrolase [Candidatus Zixiibacteriota bacterium]